MTGNEKLLLSSAFSKQQINHFGYKILTPEIYFSPISGQYSKGALCSNRGVTSNFSGQGRFLKIRALR